MQEAVTKETDFLIIGKKRRGPSTKQSKVEQLISLGVDIQIIDAEDLLWLISMEKE